MRRTDPSEAVSPSEAATALNEALLPLKAASDPNKPWQDARYVLDVTADALDVAGLALKVEEAQGDDGNDDDEATDQLGEVQWLSLMVSAARSRLLGDNYANASVKAPPPLPQPGTQDCPLVVYASQTGTAESFAQSMAKNMQKKFKWARKADAVDMKEAELKDVVVRKRVYFVVSTFGIGRPPRRAEAFYSNLQLHRGKGVRVSPEGGAGGNGDFRPLAGVEVAVAALGDSRFKDFAAFGKNLAQELSVLGAKPMFEVTTIDGKDGPAKQLEKFQEWEELVHKVENHRGGGTGGNGSGGGGGAGASSSSQGGPGGDAAASSCCVVS